MPVAWCEALHLPARPPSPSSFAISDDQALQTFLKNAFKGGKKPLQRTGVLITVYAFKKLFRICFVDIQCGQQQINQKRQSRD